MCGVELNIFLLIKSTTNKRQELLKGSDSDNNTGDTA